jgi:DNA-binding MarR family transcriptional regulator
MSDDMTEKVYDFICAYMQEQNCSPSQRDIAEGCYMALSGIQRHLDRLEAWGWIKRQEGRARSISITQANRAISKKRSND